MLYTYCIHRTAYVTVDIEADDEDAADVAFNRMNEDGDLNDSFRSSVLEADTCVDKVWEGGVDDGMCIYNAH